MLKLNPIKSDKIWGYELWIASTHPNGCQKEFMDFCGGEYPLLVKVIQANDTLSIQVHPDDDWAVKSKKVFPTKSLLKQLQKINQKTILNL